MDIITLSTLLLLKDLLIIIIIVHCTTHPSLADKRELSTTLVMIGMLAPMGL